MSALLGDYRRKPIIEYGATGQEYYFFLFYNYAVLDLREVIKKFPEIIDNKYLLVTSFSSGKIEKQMYDDFTSKGLICEYVQRNLIIGPEQAKHFISLLFSKDPGGSTIYFLNHRPSSQELENKKIYGIPALPVSIKILKRQRIDRQLLYILLKELNGISAASYYDNNWFEAICIMRKRDLFENLRVFFHYSYNLREIILD